ncbi:MAG: ABC transporter permease [Oscillospiraceae bacterium]|nr:ABC transporter permease [Oscillospiraceae bacterium]
MRQFMILLRKDLLEIFRTKKFLIILSVFIVMALLSPITAYIMPDLFNSLGEELGEEFAMLMPDATIVDSYLQFVSNISQIGMFTIVMCFGGSIVKERKKGLYVTLKNNGVKKHWFIFSKLKSQFIVVTIIYVLAVLVFIGYNYILFNEFVTTYSLLSFTALYVFLLFVICVTNFFSSVSRGAIMSIILTLVTIFGMALLDLFAFGRYLPNFLLSLSLRIFSDDSYIELLYRNIVLTLLISTIFVLASIRFCRHKE